MKKKSRRLAVPTKFSKRVKTSATYRKILVEVPCAAVTEAMPDAMTFYVDTRFTTAQVTRIRQMIGSVLAQWSTHFDHLANGAPESSYQKCVNKYARFNLSPVWFDEKLTNGSAAAGVQMDGFTTQIAANGFNRAAKAYIMYKKSGTSTIKGVNASDTENNSLTVTINAADIDNTTVSTLMLTGSLHHAWLHREGYRHPTGKYTGYMAGEASMCVMRGNRDKVPGTSDSTYTRWLD